MYKDTYIILESFSRACASVRCAHLSFQTILHTKLSAARPAYRSFADPSGEINYI